jgi:hypothetical protein
VGTLTLFVCRGLRLPAVTNKFSPRIQRERFTYLFLQLLEIVEISITKIKANAFL